MQSALSRLGKARKLEAEEEKERTKRERRTLGKNRPKRDFDAPDDDSVRHPSSASGKDDVQTHDMDLDPLVIPQPHAFPNHSAKGKQASRDDPTSPHKQAIDMLTTLASTLLGTYGETGIYEETHEGIIKQLIAEGEVPRGWRPSNIARDPLVEQTQGHENGNAVAEVKEVRQGRRSVVSRPVIARPKS